MLRHSGEQVTIARITLGMLCKECREKGLLLLH